MANILPNDDNYGVEFIEPDPPLEISAETEPYLSIYRKYADEFESSELKREPILSKINDRYTIYPIEYWDIWSIYKKQLEAHWVVDEVSLDKDNDDWNNKLSKWQKKGTIHVLAFFASADGIVNANISQNLINVIYCKEAECAYGAQMNMENTHGEMYSILLDIYVSNDLKNKLLKSIQTINGVKLKTIWCEEWINSDKTYAHKLVAFAMVEAIFFSGSFATIFWLKTLPGSPMSGLRTANKFIEKMNTCMYN